MTTLSQLMHMAATDMHLRAELAADPETALRTRGLQVSQEVVQALNSIRHLLAQSSAGLSAQLPPHIAATSAWGRSPDTPPTVPGHAAAKT